MTSLARRTLRATAAVTGMAALGAGFAGTAAAVPMTAATPNHTAVNAAQVDDFNTDDGVSQEQMSSTLESLSSEVPLGQVPSRSESPVNDLSLFSFEMPNMQMETASAAPGAGTEAMFGPMLDSMSQHAIPAVAESPGTDPDTAEFGQDNGTPFDAAGPANGATEPVFSSAEPAMTMIVGSASEMTSNNDTTSNHTVNI